MAIDIYFSDFFDVSPALLEGYGAFDISLINDLPVFIDPFLLFNSPNPVYQQLHEDIIHYLLFLRDKSRAGDITQGLLNRWYRFGEVKQSWIGFSQVGNRGAGLGKDFATALYSNLGSVFAKFGQEQITKGSHLEKLCLIAKGVGRDYISDFTTNLIKGFLLDYTQIFAAQHLRPEFIRAVIVDKIRFNYDTESWERGRYELPCFADDFVLLTPKDVLTRDETWISRRDLLNNFEQVADAIPNDELRALLNNYLLKRLAAETDPKKRKEAKLRAIEEAIQAHPEVLEYYIRQKEEHGEEAVTLSSQKVAEVEHQFITQLKTFVETRLSGTPFYAQPGDTFEEAMQRALFLKQVIENNDGYRIFYVEGESIQREQDLQILYRLTWFASPSDVNREVNNGRGPVDFKISRGNKDKSLVEFKLASNTKLRRNLEKQVEIYGKANSTDKKIKVICYFSQQELDRVQEILRELKLDQERGIILIDARSDNKPSASNA